MARRIRAGMDLTIPEGEHRRRRNELLARADGDGYDGVVLFGARSIEYATGLAHQPTERPLAVGITDDTTQIVVPRLERANAESTATPFDDVHVYFDHPQGEPMEAIAGMCRDLGIADGTVAADADGSPRRNGYTGPSLTSLVAGDVGIEEYVTDMREVKSTNEIALVREASDWATFAHRRLQAKLEPGRVPAVVAAEVEAETTAAMLDTGGERYTMTSTRLVDCNFTTGPTTAEPHSVDQTQPIEEGENVVTIVGPTVGGYTTELERTLFVGEPSATQRRYFEIVTESQEIAFETIAPGVEYAAVEAAVTDYYEEQGVATYMQCHVGHDIGLEGHERPFLDTGYEGQFRVGELFTPEPGLYVPEFGGFRHSDTVRVTDDGIERLTHYPRDIERLTVSTG